MPDLPAIERPNGKLYRPRKLVAHIVGDEDEIPSSVLVLGTHDPERAQALADVVAKRHTYASAVAVKPELVWWRDSIRDGRGWWVEDPVRGRAGVWFAEIEETELPC